MKATMRQLKTIGLIGGLSWKATMLYYDYLNIVGNRQLGKSHSPHLLVDSLDFEYAAQLLARGADTLLMDYLLQSARRLIGGGAEVLVICCNSAHKVVAELGKRIDCPVVDIRHAVAACLVERRQRRVVLLGTRYTMEHPFYREVLNQHGIECLLPDAGEIAYINDMIMTELSIGVVSPGARQGILRIARKLARQGSDAIVLACTELPLVLSQEDFEVEIIDTVKVHADSALRQALAECAA